jgi:hypothetical protein
MHSGGRIGCCGTNRKAGCCAARGFIAVAYIQSFSRDRTRAKSASMQCLMEKQTHPRFLSANQELRSALQRLESVANGTETVTDKDLNNISVRLMTVAPQVGDASRSETLDGDLQYEVAEYVKNIGALQGAMKKVCCVRMATRVHIDAEKRSADGLPNWIDGHEQAT